MPAIVLRISFRKVSGRILNAKEILDFLNPKLKLVDASIFRKRLAKIYVWEEDAVNKVQIIMERVLGTFALGDLGESTVLGIFDSTYPDCIEFWICSPKPIDCIKGRKCVQKSIPSIRKGVIKKYESDNLLLEGGEQISREGNLSRYVRGDFNIGFLLAFVTISLSSLINYLSEADKQFDYASPLIFFAIWLIVLFGEILHNRGKGVYVVK